MLQGITDKKFRFRVTAIFTAALVLLVANVAYAAWTAVGDGTGEAVAGEADDLNITPVAPTESLFPTVAVDLTVEIENPNPYNVSVETVNIDVTKGTGGFEVANDGDVHDGCNLPDALDWDGAHTYDLDDFVIEAGETDEITLEDALTMTNDANDDCQEADFTVHLVLSGQSTAAEPVNPQAQE